MLLNFDQYYRLQSNLQFLVYRFPLLSIGVFIVLMLCRHVLQVTWRSHCEVINVLAAFYEPHLQKSGTHKFLNIISVQSIKSLTTAGLEQIGRAHV